MVAEDGKISWVAQIGDPDSDSHTRSTITLAWKMLDDCLQGPIEINMIKDQGAEDSESLETMRGFSHASSIAVSARVGVGWRDAQVGVEKGTEDGFSTENTVGSGSARSSSRAIETDVSADASQYICRYQMTAKYGWSRPTHGSNDQYKTEHYSKPVNLALPDGQGSSGYMAIVVDKSVRDYILQTDDASMPPPNSPDFPSISDDEIK